MVTEGTLSSAWDQHLASEFAAKSPEQALATMTAEPYVNVVPLTIRSRGRNETRDFYANHFLSQLASRRGSSGRPQESPNGPHVSTRNRPTTPLTIPHEQRGSSQSLRWRGPLSR
jgi:hypothetical protein